MAIYNNREVYIIGPTAMSTTPETLTVRYRDGAQENVPTSKVKITEDEKKNLIKVYPSKFDNVDTITEDDIKAVRLGVAPPSDPSYKEQAEMKAKAEAQAVENKKHVDAATEAAKKSVDKPVDKVVKK